MNQNENQTAGKAAPLNAGESFLLENSDIESVDLLIADINGVMRGKWAPAEALKKVCHPGINLPMSIFGLDIWGREVEETGLHIDTGDRDGFCRAIDGRISRVNWAGHPTAQVLMSMLDDKGEPFHADPRNALQKVVDRLEKAGLTPVVAFELEFYLVDPAAFQATGKMMRDRDRAHGAFGPEPQNMYSLSELSGQSELFADIRAGALAMGLPIDTIIKEAAPGQFEVNLKHRADPMAAADDTVLLRRLIAECSNKHGLRATFMAKPFLEWPGNGMHVHASLLDKQGANIFSGDTGEERLAHAAAGLLSTMRDSLLLFIPGFNGYRRLQPGSYAPTRIAWGRNNRSVAVRVPASEPAATRLEHRLSGADANPYLITAAVLAGILDGLDQQYDPGPPVVGNAYEQTQLREQFWRQAIGDFLQSDFVADHFGTDFRHIYGQQKLKELRSFHAEVTDLEYRSYLRAL